MTVRITSVVHALAFAPGIIAIILGQLQDAPFAVGPWLPWALGLLSLLCVYAANWIPRIFEMPTAPPAAALIDVGPVPIPPAVTPPAAAPVETVGPRAPPTVTPPEPGAPAA